jgi:hypothetical protein
MDYVSGLRVLYNQFLFKRPLGTDDISLGGRKLRYILLSIFLWGAFAVTLLAIPISIFFFHLHYSWVAVLCILAVGFLIAGLVNFHTNRPPVKGKKKSGSPGPFEFIDLPFYLGGGEETLLIIFVIFCMLIAILFFVFIWIPLLFLFFVLITGGGVYKFHKAAYLKLEARKIDTIQRVAERLSGKGGLLSSSWGWHIDRSPIRERQSELRTLHCWFDRTFLFLIVFSFIGLSIILLFNAAGSSTPDLIFYSILTVSIVPFLVLLSLVIKRARFPGYITT